MFKILNYSMQIIHKHVHTFTFSNMKGVNDNRSEQEWT